MPTNETSGISEHGWPVCRWFRFIAFGCGSCGSCWGQRVWLFAMLLGPSLMVAGDTNSPTSIRRGEVWYSTSRLKRIACDYAVLNNIEFDFDHTPCYADLIVRGSNLVAKIGFTPGGIGALCPVFEIDRRGNVLTNRLVLSRCGLGDDLDPPPLEPLMTLPQRVEEARLILIGKFGPPGNTGKITTTSVQVEETLQGQYPTNRTLLVTYVGSNWLIPEIASRRDKPKAGSRWIFFLNDEDMKQPVATNYFTRAIGPKKYAHDGCELAKDETVKHVRELIARSKSESSRGP